MRDCVECGAQFATRVIATGPDGRPLDQDLCPDCRRRGPDVPEPVWLQRMRPDNGM